MTGCILICQVPWLVLILLPTSLVEELDVVKVHVEENKGLHARLGEAKQQVVRLQDSEASLSGKLGSATDKLQVAMKELSIKQERLQQVVLSHRQRADRVHGLSLASRGLD